MNNEIIDTNKKERKMQGNRKKILKKYTLNGVVVFLLFFTCIDSYPDMIDDYSESQVIVKFDRHASENAIDELISIYGMRIEEKMPQIGYYVLSLSHDYTVSEILSIWSEIDIVEIIESNNFSLTHTIPDDEYFYKQWCMGDADSDKIEESNMHILQAWELEPGEPDVIIAVIDLGFDINHEDLQENIRQNPGEIPDNGVDDDGNGYIDDIIGWDFVNQSEGAIEEDNDWNVEDNDPFVSKTSHGNVVIGIIGATKNNGIGIAGVAGDCKIMLIRAGCFTPEGNLVLDTLSIIKGVIYAVENGASVINISSGSRNYNESYKDALKYAISRGAIIVCSAGNFGNNKLVYPAAYKLVGLISVGASSKSDNRCRFSSYGDWVDVSAPGESILSTLLSNKYGRVKGTSLSAPFVSGISGLIISKYPDFTPEEVKNVIINSVDRFEGLEGANLTSGRVNAFTALNEPCTETLIIADNYEEKKLTPESENDWQGCFISLIGF